MTRQMLRTNFFYTLNEALPPGQYQFVFLSSGTEVARRAFALETKFIPRPRAQEEVERYETPWQNTAEDAGLDVEQFDVDTNVGPDFTE